MIRIVLSTFADADSAARIVRTLVAEKLAARDAVLIAIQAFGEQLT